MVCWSWPGIVEDLGGMVDSDGGVDPGARWTSG
jgi:hypothetical protein